MNLNASQLSMHLYDEFRSLRIMQIQLLHSKLQGGGVSCKVALGLKEQPVPLGFHPLPCTFTKACMHPSSLDV